MIFSSGIFVRISRTIVNSRSESSFRYISNTYHLSEYNIYMKLTYDQIKNVFGSEDKNIGQLVIFLAINYPNITPTGIFNIFKTTIEHYSTESDHIEDQVTWINR